MSPVIDAHHHLLDPARFDYPWLTPELAAIDRRFGPDDLAPELAAAGIDRTILVQTIASIDETREFLATAASVPFIGGVIGWVDLTDPGVGGTLDALRGGPGGEWLVGIRHQVHDEPDPDWLLRPDVRRGLAAIEAAGLAYDLLVRSRELPAALIVAREMAGLRFVIDHAGQAADPLGRDRAVGEPAPPVRRAPERVVQAVRPRHRSGSGDVAGRRPGAVRGDRPRDVRPVAPALRLRLAGLPARRLVCGRGRGRPGPHRRPVDHRARGRLRWRGRGGYRLSVAPDRVG